MRWGPPGRATHPRDAGWMSAGCRPLADRAHRPSAFDWKGRKTGLHTEIRRQAVAGCAMRRHCGRRAPLDHAARQPVARSMITNGSRREVACRASLSSACVSVGAAHEAAIAPAVTLHCARGRLSSLSPRTTLPTLRAGKARAPAPPCSILVTGAWRSPVFARTSRAKPIP